MYTRLDHDLILKNFHTTDFLQFWTTRSGDLTVAQFVVLSFWYTVYVFYQSR